MKLRSVALNQFKKFTSPMRLDDIDDGLNVIIGPNEMGKSTLLDALRAALFEKYSSKAQSITALQNDRNQAGPVVELAFEMEDGLYRIAKRFIKKPYARLSCPDGRTLEGDAAEDTLRRLLGFDEPGKTGAKPESLGMWSVLWVQQGQSFGALDLPETARSNLHSALESEVGTVLGGRRGRALPQTIDEQRGELLTSSAKPRGAYKEVIDSFDALQDDLANLRMRRQELSQSLDDLEDAQAQLARLSSGDRDQAYQTELDAARTRREQLATLEAQIAAAVGELRLKEGNLERAEQAQKVRHKLKEEVASAEQSVMNAGARMDEVGDQERQARIHLDTLRAAVRGADSTVTQSEDNLALKRRFLAAVERAVRVRALQEQCSRAQDAEARQHEAQQGIAAILVNDKAIERIRTAASAIETINARLSAAATTIAFEMSAKSLASIEIDGKSLVGERQAVQVVEPATISILNFGRITVDPAIRDRDKLIAQQRDATSKLKAALGAVGAASVQHAEDQLDRRRQLLEQAELARQEAALHAPTTDDYEAGAKSLADYIEGVRQVVAREKGELGLPELPSKQEAQAALRNAEDHAAETRHALGTARAQLSGPEELLGRLQADLGGVKARHEDAKTRLHVLREEYKKAEDAYPETQLQAAIDVARSALSCQEQAVSNVEAQRTDETLAQLDAHIARLDNAIRERRDKRANLREAIAGLKSHVEALEGVGLDESIEQKAREAELCDQQRKRFEREAEVLGLLLSTLRSAEHDAKERYLSPVLNRVRPYLQLLFPRAEIAIDENLRITGIVRDAGYEESFHHLSIGTREQIAILVRLAFAEMLMEQGHPATVILDDALVFSDDRRMNRMFDILNMAARYVQVIVFTCREQLFEGLGGRQLSLSPGGSEELISA